MPTEREIKLRVRSITNIQQVTKAQQTISASKMRRAQDAVLASRPFEERLRDNTQTAIPEQVCFRIDFPAWLTTLTARERRLVREMAKNERTLDLSQRFDVSPARISQLRRELHNDWTRFCEDDLT